MNTITFDIETIPTTKPLTKIEQEILDARIKREIEYTKEQDIDEVRRRLMGTNPYFGEICVLGLRIDHEEPIALYGDEKDILTNFWSLIKDFKGTFVSFNGLKFDVPFIITRTILHKVKPTNKQFLNKRRFIFYPHFDCYAFLSDWGETRNINLKLACEFFGIRSSKDGEVVASKVAEYVAKGEITKVAKYCAEDVRATHELYNILANYIG
ncbi:MAG: ribonuclease H-like domain-containing protein [Candidatus Pacearchaeota archaeon]